VRTKAALGVDFEFHDLRRTAASIMTGSGSGWWSARFLNHVECGITAVYDCHSYDSEKRFVLLRWDFEPT
jgi:integrase